MKIWMNNWLDSQFLTLKCWIKAIFLRNILSLLYSHLYGHAYLRWEGKWKLIIYSMIGGGAKGL